MIGHVLGSRASIGGPLGSGRGGAAAAWYLAGGVAAANCVAAYAPIGAASLAASYDNIAAPGNGLADGTYDAAPGVAPTWSAAAGWTFNGTQYLANGLAPTSVNWSMFCRFSDFAYTTMYGGLAGGYESTPSVHRFILYARAGGTNYGFGNDGFLVIPGALTGGIVAFSGAACYLNGAVVGTIATCALNTTKRMIIGGYLADNVTPQSLYSGNIQAVAIYNTTLSAAQVAAISAAMAALA